MITIDGSQGEGGGQILRTSLGLSLVTGQAVRLVKIRANRDKPGLMRQHQTCVEAAVAIGDAEVRGAAIGSTELVFAPKKISMGEYRFSVGTAGSTTLVLQTILPALLTVDGPSTLTLEGGTHNPFAPPFDFLAKSFLPLINRMGPLVTATLERPGFYPAGGGRVVVSIEPHGKLTWLNLLERGPIMDRVASAWVSGLPRSIADRELKVIADKLRLPADALHVVEVENPRGPGNFVAIEIRSEQVTEVCSAIGQRGVPAEAVARHAAGAAERYIASGAAIGEHLADQLLVPLALSGAGSFRTLRPTQHTLTNIEVIKRFLAVNIEPTQANDGQWQIDVANA